MNSKKTKRFWITALSLLVVSSISLYVYAQQGRSRQQTEGGRQGQQQQQQTGKLLSTEKLLDAEVKSTQQSRQGQQGQPGQQGQQSRQTGAEGRGGEMSQTLGTVEEVVFDDENDAVYCVVVAANDTYYPVPWQAFEEESTKQMSASQEGVRRQEDPDQPYGAAETDKAKSRWGWQRRGEKSTLSLNISPEQFQQAPNVDSLDIAQLSDPSLKQRVCDFYSQQGMVKGDQAGQAMGGSQAGQQRGQRGQQAQQQAQANLFKASEIMGDEVQNYRGEDIAGIDDFIIDAQHGSLAYALLSYGGFLGIGDELAAVPWSALTLQREEEYAMLDATEEQLQSARIEEGDLDRLSDRQFARQIHQAFEAEPYWTTFAFIPAASPDEAVKAWQPDSDYNKNFKKDAMTTVEGTISNIGAFRPTENAAQGLRLKVKTMDDKSHVVYAGPRQWAMQQDVDWKTGKQVTVKGSKTQVDGKQVIIASEITVEGKTVRLRDNEGKPQWNTDDLKRSMQQQQGQGQRQQEQN